MLQVQGFQGDVAQIEADCLVVNLFAGVTSPGTGHRGCGPGPGWGHLPNHRQWGFSR